MLSKVGPVGGQVLGGEPLLLGEGRPVRGVDQEDLIVPVGGRILQGEPHQGTQPRVVGRLKSSFFHSKLDRFIGLLIYSDDSE